MARANKMLINKVDDCVDEMLDNIARTNPGLARLHGHRVIIRDDIERFRDQGRVTTICGGGSGHEPFAAGFVGRGMLSAAVCGSVFASPPSEEILAAIEAVRSRRAGTLLIVANYTGDRLNFGIAAERARAQGHTIDMVVVGEDCALQSCDRTAGRRGLVGIVMAMKVAGALAEEGKSLAEIGATLRAVTSGMGTIGLSLGGCSIPGRANSSFRLGEHEMELGLGAHGEAGVRRLPLLSADDAADAMLAHMTNAAHASHLRLTSGGRVAVMVNNLGGMSALELHAVARRFLAQLRERHRVTVERCYFGHFMTSLDMAGFNVNVTRVDDVIVACLDADTNAPAWPRVAESAVTGKRLNDDDVTVAGSASTPKAEVAASGGDGVGDVIIGCVRAACEALIAGEEKLNRLDDECGDGDCGSTLARGAADVIGKLARWTAAISFAQLLLNVAASAENSMGGASGGLYSLFFTAAAGSVAAGSDDSPTPEVMRKLLARGMAAVCQYGGARVGDRTLLDALAPACDVLDEMTTSSSGKELAGKMADAAEAGAERTKTMEARAGRASYVSGDRIRDKMDPGACAVAILFRAVCDNL